METPGANAANILFEATKEDNPKPLFLFPEKYESVEQNYSFWTFSSKDSPIVFPLDTVEESAEIFVFLSPNIDLADQLEAFLATLKSKESLQVGRFILFISSPHLLKTPDNFFLWLDGVTHFTDAMLFTERSNDNAAAIKTIQDRYSSMHYPMETYILAKKNNPWSRILDSTPRRISHLFDDSELWEPEDLPENDRYLALHPTGERKRLIPLLYKDSAC